VPHAQQFPDEDEEKAMRVTCYFICALYNFPTSPTGSFTVLEAAWKTDVPTPVLEHAPRPACGAEPP